MARYIDANILKEKILKERDKISLTRIDRYSFGVATANPHGTAMRGGIRKALRCLEQTPAADVVEVVRCADCKHCDKYTKWNNQEYLGCNFNCDITEVAAEHYCSYGERRTEE